MLNIILSVIGSIVTMILAAYLTISIANISSAKEKIEFLNKLSIKLFMGSIFAYQIYAIIQYGSAFYLELEILEGPINRTEVLRIVLLTFGLSLNLIFMLFLISMLTILTIVQFQLKHLEITKIGLQKSKAEGNNSVG